MPYTLTLSDKEAFALGAALMAMLGADPIIIAAYPKRKQFLECLEQIERRLRDQVAEDDPKMRALTALEERLKERKDG